MKMRVLIVADVDVPDSLLRGAAMPALIAERAKYHCERSVSQVWPNWDHEVEATVTMGPDHPKLDARPDERRLQHLIDLHSKLLQENSYCYFELAYTRTTMWMAWICTDQRENNPQRIVLAQGQGESPDAAARAALESYVAGNGEGAK